jgi:hypothetical protein
MSGDTQLREILVARDDLEISTEAIQGAEESDSLLTRGPERAAVSFSAGQDRLQQSCLKKGILKKGGALRRASASSEVPSSAGMLRSIKGRKTSMSCCLVMSNRGLSAECLIFI